MVAGSLPAPLVQHLLPCRPCPPQLPLPAGPAALPGRLVARRGGGPARRAGHQGGERRCHSVGWVLCQCCCPQPHVAALLPCSPPQLLPQLLTIHNQRRCVCASAAAAFAAQSRIPVPCSSPAADPDHPQPPRQPEAAARQVGRGLFCKWQCKSDGPPACATS